VPIEACVVVPLSPLPELVSHEQELLAGVPDHESVKSPQVREPLHSSPGIFAIIEPFRWTTSSCESGSMKFSVNAYRSEKVIFSWW